MLQQVAADSGAVGWAIGSMLFFLCFWVVMAVRTWRARPDEMRSRASLPLNDD